MTDTKPTIDEQIAKQRKHCNQYKEDYDILASLERLKAMDAVQVPDEPMRYDGNNYVESEDYDTLRDLLRRVTAERDACAQMNDDQARRVYAAESKLAAMLKLGAEPNEGMMEAAYHRSDDVTWNQAVAIFTAMFAKMIEELK